MRKRSRAGPSATPELERLVEELGHLALAHRHEDAVDVEHELLGRRLHGELDRALHDLGEPRVRLQPRDVRRLVAVDDDPVEQLGDRPLLDRVLAERGQHVRDVVHERRVRADDEHAAQLLAVRVEEPRRAVQPDRRLAGAGSALHDERAVGIGRDQPVLVGLDRRDDVAHAPLAAPLELLEQEVGHRRAFDGGAVERLVGDVDDAAPVGAVAAPLRDALRIGRRRRVERAAPPAPAS